MIKKFLFPLLFVCAGLSAQDSTKIVNPNTNFNVIEYYDYVITITSNKNDFFSGKLEAAKNGKVEFMMEKNFSDYSGHSLIDMDGDGSKELLLSLSEGASPYVMNALYIFDAKKGGAPVALINNADVDTSLGSPKPLITSYTKLSPSVIGMNYFWFMEYSNGGLKLYKPTDDKLKGMLKPDIESIADNLTQYEDFNEKCSDGVYNVFFEAVFIQNKIAGDDNASTKFFDKYYKCPNKKLALDQVQNSAADTYGWLNDPSNFKYGE